MKRWLLVVSPALAIVVIGTALVLMSDRDPAPIASPSALEGSSVPTAVDSPATGAAGITGSIGTPAPPGSEEPGETTGPQATGPQTTGAQANGSRETASPSPAPSPGSDDDQGENTTSGVPGPGGAVTFLLVVKDGEVEPQTLNVRLGASVVLEASSVDVSDVLQVRGLGIREAIKPGKSVSIEFVADESGSFALILRDAGLLVAQIEVAGAGSETPSPSPAER